MSSTGFFNLFLVTLLISTQFRITSQSDILERTMSKWSQQIYQSINPLRDVMGTDQLSRMYNGSMFGVQEMTDAYARKLVDDAIAELTKLIRKKEKALEKLRNSIEEEYKKQEPLDNDEREDSCRAIETLKHFANTISLCYIRAKSVSLFPYPVDENGTNIVPCNESQYLPLEADPLFGNFYVSRNISAAHVPTNVYDLSKAIRTVGNWTHHLDEVFKGNIEEDPLLKWQYFCSSTGFFKYYPGAMWEVQLSDLKLDFFDCRSTAWYVGAASYPIEMVILADKSGSMKGRRNTICNATISELLNTLTDDDFFNVIYFSESLKFAEELVKDRLIQATRPNKDRIVRGFADHNPNGTSNFKAALNEAFTLLNISNNGTGINRCNKIIILITDGVPDDFSELFEELNHEKNVRVFTFLLGQHSADENIVRKIACLNRGMSANIANLADVKENVLNYIDIVARSNAILDDSFVRWSGITKLQLNLMKLFPENFTRPEEPILNSTLIDNSTSTEEAMQEDEPEANDAAFWPPLRLFKAKESQFYVTLSRAAYDKTNFSVANNKGTLLGVTGVDIPMEDIQDVLRSWKIGPLSYFFGVTNNGFVLFHPDYRPMHGTQLKRYYRHVDVDEVEQPLDFALNPHTALPMYNSTLRRMMIDRLTTSTVLTTIKTPEDFLSGLPMTKKVFSAPLPDTPFVFGLAVRWVAEANRGFPIPKYDTSKFWRQGSIRASDTTVLNPQFVNPAVSCEIVADRPYGAKLAPLSFCKFRREPMKLFLEDPLCVLRNMAIDKSLQEENECDMDHIARIFMDARASANIYDYWRRKSSHPAVRKFDVQQAFSVHQSGLLRYFNYSQTTYEEFLEEINRGSESPIYKSTVLTPTFYENMKILVFRPPPKQIFRTFVERNITVPMVVTGVISNHASEAVAMGIAGVQFSYQKFAQLFFDIVNNCNSAECLKCNQSGAQCFLTTTAGQIILSTHGEKAVSQNVKELDCALMEALVAANIITEHEIYDFQAICIEAVTPDLNFGSRLFSPIAFIFKIIGQTLGKLFAMITSLLVIGPGATAQGIWDSLPPIQGGFMHLNDPKTPSDNPPFNFHGTGDDRFGYHQKPDIDYALPNRAGGIDDPFYRDYEVPKPFDLPSESHISSSPPEVVDPSKTPADNVPSSEKASDLPLFYETARFYSQKNYIYEDPEDPWLMQQQAFSELNLCYANEPTLHPPPPPPPTPPPSTVLLNNSSNETMAMIDLTDTVTTREPLTQILTDNMSLVNASVGVSASRGAKETPPKKINTIPGTLLRCVQRIVQMRCHAAVHSNNQIGRQACEVMCDAVRQRMPQLTEFLHDCRQPLDACTQRHSVFYLNKEAHAGRGGQIHGTYGSTPRIHSGTYCPNCGNIDWAVASIPNTNLLLIMTLKPPGKPTLNCHCECRRRYRYGAQLKGDKMIPRTQNYRRDPVTPKTCEMVSYKIENYTDCLSGSPHRLTSQLVWVVLLILSTVQLM